MSSWAHAAKVCKSEKTLSYAEQIARLEPKVDLDILDFDFFTGGGIVAGYEYKVEPAYTNGLYSRQDRWQVTTKAVPENLIKLDKGIDVKVSGGLKHHSEATFIRFVKDPCEAMRLKPYAPNRMPLKAEKALSKKFNVGDYFLFRGSVGFVASAEIVGMLTSSLWGMGISGSYLMEGFYQLHVVRLDDKHVRMKIVAHRGHNVGASVGIGWDGDFDVFGVSVLDNGLERFVNLKPVKLKADFNKSNVFMVDYVLDLSDSEVAKAYEGVLKKVKYFKGADLIKPFKNDKEVSNMLLLDISPLEELYQQDRNNNQVGRLKRNLRTSAKQKTQTFGLELGNKIVGFKWNTEKATSLMGVRQDNNFQDRYILKTWEKNWRGNFLSSWSKSSEETGIRALFQADEEFRSLGPVNIVNYMYRKKNRFSYSTLKKIQMNLKKGLPVEVYNSIPWILWGQGPKTKYTNFGMRYDFVMSPDAITEAPQISIEAIKALFRSHIKSKGLTEEDYFPTGGNSRDPNRITSEEIFERHLRKFARHLSTALNRSLTPDERLGGLNSLIRNDLFSQSGFSFIMSLRPDQMDRLYHIDLKLSANEGIIDFDYGDAELSALYRKLLTIKAALDDDALDIIREAESISSLPKANEA